MRQLFSIATLLLIALTVPNTVILAEGSLKGLWSNVVTITAVVFGRVIQIGLWPYRPGRVYYRVSVLAAC